MALLTKGIKWLLNPHKQKIESLKKKYKELDELSTAAIGLEDINAYHSLQNEMREVFFDYITAIFVDGLYTMLPHVLLIWLLSIKYRTITIPVVNYQVNIVIWYPLLYLLLYLSYKTVRKLLLNSKVNRKRNVLV